MHATGSTLVIKILCKHICRRLHRTYGLVSVYMTIKWFYVEPERAICTQELLLWDDLGRNHRMSNVDMGQTNEARFSVHVGTHVR